MANNIRVKDFDGVVQVVKTTDTASVHTHHHNIDLVIPGTAATNLGKAEDAAHTSGDVGVMALGVRQDTVAALGANNDYVPLTMDELGRLRVRAVLEPYTAGGLTTFQLFSAATTNATSVKGSAATLYGWHIFSPIAVVRYVKLFNKATAPTVGTDTPLLTLPVNTLLIPSEISIEQGLAFPLGLALAITTNAVASDATAVGANDVVVHLWYK